MRIHVSTCKLTGRLMTYIKRLRNDFLQKLNLATKTLRKNALHFFYFVPLCLRGGHI